MKKKASKAANLVLATFLSLFALNCENAQSPQSKTVESSATVQNLTVNNISQLERGVIVRFAATLRMRSESNCVELFVGDNFKKYGGDEKHAAFAILASESSLAARFDGNKEVVVTGKMTFVKDVTDTSKTCGIVTGQLFEITGIEQL